MQHAQESLEDVLAMGLTYEDLIQQGMHPEFLSRLFAKLQDKASDIGSRPSSVPPPAPVSQPQSPVPTPTEPENNNVPDVDQFLRHLAPSLTSSQGRFNKKRTVPRDRIVHPPKKRPFGRSQATEVVIDVSSDEDESNSSEEDKPSTPAAPPPHRPHKSKLKVMSPTNN